MGDGKGKDLHLVIGNTGVVEVSFRCLWIFKYNSPVLSWYYEFYRGQDLGVGTPKWQYM